MHLPDYHTHTALCGHASGQPEDYVNAAQALGLMGIGVADHLPLLPLGDPRASVCMEMSSLPGYVEEVLALKAAFPGYVLLGVEADYRPHTYSDVGALLNSQPFDYVIGSVHFLDDWAFDDPRFASEYANVDVDEIWGQYFELVGDAAESGLFTIMGHLDLVKKLGYRPTRALDAESQRLVQRLAKAGVVVEINTSGLYKPAAEAYPDVKILRLLREAGVPITFGSDAHEPGHVGRDFAHALELARTAGYEQFAALRGSATGGRAEVVMHSLEGHRRA